MTDADFRQRARVVLRNMAAERPGVLNAIFGRRWIIADEPLRADAQRLLQEEARTAPDERELAREDGAVVTTHCQRCERKMMGFPNSTCETCRRLIAEQEQKAKEPKPRE